MTTKRLHIQITRSSGIIIAQAVFRPTTPGAVILTSKDAARHIGDSTKSTERLSRNMMWLLLSSTKKCLMLPQKNIEQARDVTHR
ncbi:hypothetical protein BIW11_04605 [Tropilaelaps mercedesae]|uniref:Uncharacterized protein n=1 Tax=Tropilaelaps mercedesae TaxID=418985 RepID=A0A1V9X478_9ACAR|nr:hypothetical protein BIW11_04605 [Tropilaelaps mercedesae]